MAEQETINIDDKPYNVADLSDEAKQAVLNLRACDQRIQQLQQDVAIARTARAAYAVALRRALPAGEGEGASESAADQPAEA